eukprot:14011750-Ditylum_brightwellii.AAC.1
MDVSSASHIIPVPYTPTITTFSSYIHTLEYWESSLLDNIILHKPINLIAQHWLQGTEKIVISSNGSSLEGDNIMSFGWKIVTLSDEPLAKHSGLTFGHTMSFWSEGYDLLSVARFLYHGSIYTQTTIQHKVDMHIDNKGIVERINNQISYPHYYSYKILCPDWDLIAQAAITLQQYGKRLSINHIKSHQDDDTPEE